MYFGPQVREGCGPWCLVHNNITIILTALYLMAPSCLESFFNFHVPYWGPKICGEVLSALITYSGSCLATNDKPNQSPGLSPLFFFPLPGGISLSPVFLSQVSLLFQENCISSSISSDVLHSQKGLAHFTYGEGKHENSDEKIMFQSTVHPQLNETRRSLCWFKLLVSSCYLLLCISHVPRSTYCNDEN